MCVLYKYLAKRYSFDYFSRYVRYVLAHCLLCIIRSWLLILSLYSYLFLHCPENLCSSATATHTLFSFTSLCWLSYVVPNHFLLSKCTTCVHFTLNIRLLIVRYFMYSFEVIPKSPSLLSARSLYMYFHEIALLSSPSSVLFSFDARARTLFHHRPSTLLFFLFNPRRTLLVYIGALCLCSKGRDDLYHDNDAMILLTFER